MSLARILLAGAALATLAGPALADESVAGIVITAHRLDEARMSVEPSLGATTHALSMQVIDALPGGQNLPLNQVLLQTPGVVQDSFGQLHVRGDHGNLQYRINNVILPEGLSVFGQALSPRLASNVALITGALPAQYGLRTAGVVDITTRSGLQPGGRVGIYGGAHEEVQPSVEYGGTWGPASAFASLSFEHTGLGIESPDGSSTPLHDRSDQLQAFAYLDRILGDSSRLSLILGTSQQAFQIPNRRGLHPDLGLSVDGRTDDLSDDLDQRQREGTTFAIVSYLYAGERFTGQASLFSRYSSLTYRPDVTGEILFNGIAQDARKSDTAAGVQLEGAYKATDAHTVRAGVIVQGDRAVSRTTSQVLDLTGAAPPDRPIAIVDDGARTAWTWSAFLQDEWKLLPELTLNYGLRFDAVDAFRREHQLSPRVNLVWTPREGTTLHAGYARYFTPPPFELVADPTVARFNGTTAQFPNPVPSDLPLSERSHYFDVGVEQKLGPLTVSLDAYYRTVRNLLDEGQFGSPIVLTPFNYARGYARGAELSASYARGPFSAYANLAVSKVQGRGIVTAQANFDPADLAYIRDHWIYVDHDQRVTASAGASYRLGDTRLGASLLFGTGLRRDGAVPNGAHAPSYTQVNLTVSHEFERGALKGVTARLDLINAFDKTYLIRDGTGIGVGAPQYGPRRGLFAGLSRRF